MVRRGMTPVRHARSTLAVGLLVIFGLASVGITSAPDHRTNTLGEVTDIGVVSMALNGTSGGIEGSAMYTDYAPVALPAPLASPSAVQKPFPIGYVFGGILVLLGIGGGIYGQRLRIRGRRPPRS